MSGFPHVEFLPSWCLPIFSVFVPHLTFWLFLCPPPPPSPSVLCICDLPQCQSGGLEEGTLKRLGRRRGENQSTLADFGVDWVCAQRCADGSLFVVDSAVAPKKLQIVCTLMCGTKLVRGHRIQDTHGGRWLFRHLMVGAKIGILTRTDYNQLSVNEYLFQWDFTVSG